MQQAKNEQKASDARREVNGEFKTIADDLTQQFRQQLGEAEAALYEPVDKEIMDARKKEELAMLEKQRKEALTLKSELNSLKDRLLDKQKQLARAVAALGAQ